MKPSKSIKSKIYRTIVLIGIIMFFSSLILSTLIMVPSFGEREIEGISNTSVEMVQQIDSTISFAQDYTENLALSVAQNNNIMNYFYDSTEQNKQIATLHLNQLISAEGLIRCVMIEKVDGPRLDSLTKISENDKEQLDTEWYQRIYDSSFGSSLSPVYTASVNNENAVTTAYSKVFYTYNKRYVYTVFINLNKLLYETRVIGDTAIDHYGLIDSEGNIFYSRGKEDWAALSRENAGQSLRNQIRHSNGAISLVQGSVNNKWAVSVVVSYGTILHGFARYIVAMLIILTSFLVLVLLFLSRAMSRIIKPVTSLSHSMESVALKNLDCEVEVVGDDEIGRLGVSFNTMLADLKESLEIIRKKEEEKQQIKFSLLISQIDPHFIYNTINSINYLARQNRCEDVVTMNSALISILCDRLRVNDIEITDTISNEIKVLEQYIIIQRYRYDGKLNLTWRVDDDLLEEQIPKNLIQPLVENSLFHGLINEETGDIEGTIEIIILKQQNSIVIKVQDDGQGMSEERLKQVREAHYRPEERGRGIGLSNIRERLFYLYRTYDCMKIESGLKKGTVITLTLPVHRLDEKYVTLDN